MVVNNTAIDHLMEIGFTEYEARTYVALLGSHPATAYETAQVSGIPTSKIYEVLARLHEKGVVSISGDESKKKYIPIQAQEFISRSKNKYNKTLDALEKELETAETDEDVSYIWNLYNYGILLDKAERIIKNSENNILISGWKEELVHLDKALKEQNTKGVNISIVHFGEISIETGMIFQHPIEDTIYGEKGGRGLVIIADSTTALMGTVFENYRVEGACSMNSGFVTLAEDYIKHDIYLMKIVKRFDNLLIEKFGKGYEKLRDVFHDEDA